MADRKHLRQRNRQLAANRRLAGERTDRGQLRAIVEVVREQDGGQLRQERGDAARSSCECSTKSLPALTARTAASPAEIGVKIAFIPIESV